MAGSVFRIYILLAMQVGGEPQAPPPGWVEDGFVPWTDLVQSDPGVPVPDPYYDDTATYTDDYGTADASSLPSAGWAGSGVWNSYNVRYGGAYSSFYGGGSCLVPFIGWGSSLGCACPGYTAWAGVGFGSGPLVYYDYPPRVCVDVGGGRYYVPDRGRHYWQNYGAPYGDHGGFITAGPGWSSGNDRPYGQGELHRDRLSVLPRLRVGDGRGSSRGLRDGAAYRNWPSGDRRNRGEGSGITTDRGRTGQAPSAAVTSQRNSSAGRGGRSSAADGERRTVIRRPASSSTQSGNRVSGRDNEPRQATRVPVTRPRASEPARGQAVRPSSGRSQSNTGAGSGSPPVRGGGRRP